MSVELAWQLLCAALVIFMTPGLAFFYGGLVKAKSVVSMMMLSFGSIAVVTVLYVLYGGTGIAGNGTSGGTKLFGNPFEDFGMTDLVTSAGSGDAGNLFGGHAFLVAFCIITVALVSGAVADRARFWPWMIFAVFFATFVVFPTFRWIWGVDAEGNFYGWLANNVYGLGGSLDWAGGTVIHQSAGAAALALALVLGRRKVGFSKEETVAHNVPLVLIGTAILWFGWFGFNTGVFGADEGQTSLIFINTLLTPAAGLLGWLVVEQFKDGKPTAVGAASGIVTGLVAITPACAFVSPVWALVLGLVAGAVCALAVELKFKLGFDDTLDVVGIHLVAGFIGCIWVGIFGMETLTGGSLVFGGNLKLLGAQVLSSLTVIVFSFVVAFIIGFAIEKTIGFRAKEEDEVAGIDTVHHEPGYSELA
ncbi:Amt family ammonium transporter [Nocardioides luteus]|uniref:Ammonium transporter n=1 Tax=Nocardioides luteus TaxID=1844 RepID=A0ABQ5SUH6_9ACTN|nr:ammonium transporter [Nocardioides luteus]MDR7309828.1 Amt family ammonium transporter [Nocardioides luteus]GGR72913.1 ammonium transporter [Nocardioides luteus]GLJ67263.1 ammonium transporter [Nocardioides luteus]